MYLFRSSQMDQRPDPSFKKYFDWPIHKDPRGTVKARTVLEEKPTLLSLESSRSRSYIRTSKKKKKSTLKNLKTHIVTDEDFLLLESFLIEISMRGDQSQKAPDQVRLKKSIRLF